jgi:hypothetical protein
VQDEELTIKIRDFWTDMLVSEDCYISQAAVYNLPFFYCEFR